MSYILIIEDNRDVRENTAELLSLAGYETKVANDGKAGLELARQEKPDLILCDIMMPVLDGYGVLKAIENIPLLAGVPFIFITSKTEKADFRRGMDMGADDYLPKPFKGSDLIRVVSARIKKSRMFKEKPENDLTPEKQEVQNSDGQDALNKLVATKSVRKYAKKNVIFTEGDTANFLLLVQKGKIKVFKSNEWGKEYIVDICNNGDYIGYSALLDEGTYKESAIAIEDSEIVFIQRQDFFNLLHQNHNLALQFIKTLSGNFIQAYEKMLKLAYNSARKRVAEALVLISKKYIPENPDELVFAISRENISALTGVSPESVSRNLTDFKEEGLIETGSGQIRIINLKKLESVKS